jgi:hypothetical protein
VVRIAPDFNRAAIAFLCLLGGYSTGANADPDTWRWFGNCPAAQALAIRVALDRKTLFRKVVPICRTAAQDKESFTFTFTAPRPITWSGYRDSDLRAAKAERIEGESWLAGGEADGLLLGVSFSTKTTIVMNTVHRAKPTEQTGSEIEKGLVITTQPVHGWSIFRGKQPGPPLSGP